MEERSPRYCLYYRACVERSACLYLVAMLKSVDHMCFDRTVDKAGSIFEFFVPPDMEELFLDVIRPFQERGEILDFEKLPNRIAHPSQESECTFDTLF